ncbi:MAG: NADH-quinone oxidoreductase subunit F [Deltaproteobacteria bacterium]|jgi:NADH-quinone oxidoreductase subunit F|nr:NADH-quinone oxidoreductase subunit F [Deltaproteobacteria bacterium]
MRALRILTEGADAPEPLDAGGYLARGGYAGLRKALEMGARKVVEEVRDAKLLGRGGAAYPAGSKWEHLMDIGAFPKHIVCNADEGEPGTFKDRFIMERVPFRLIEGMTIAGLVFGSSTGFVYVRGEYRSVQRGFMRAMESARFLNLLGRDIMGSGLDFDIAVVSGAGAYVCGENSALLNSTQGLAGRPRIKPPHLAEVGLFGAPTLVNNVETFANVPSIVTMGGTAFLEAGHPDSGGTKLVCLSGHVARPGVYEVPLGSVTLREAVFSPELGGGLRDGARVGFLHLGGQSGPLAPPELLDTVYSYSDLRKAGLSVGSGAVVVADDTVNVLDYLMSVARFFVRESCGKCTPCRTGNPAVLKILQDLSVPGLADRRTLEKLWALADVMTQCSFCGLGRTATVALKSAWKAFPEEIERNAIRLSQKDGASRREVSAFPSF